MSSYLAGAGETKIGDLSYQRILTVTEIFKGMAGGICPRRLYKGFSSKYQHISTEDGWIVQQPKHREYDNKEKDNITNDVNCENAR